MKLGEMLVRDGRLTVAQLQAALDHQARAGGRLGTILFEDGMIDLDALTVYLGLELGMPIATGPMLERAKLAAVRLLRPAQAYAHKCVPLVVQDRQLLAAVEDPHDFDNLEAIAALTGYRVLPRACPEVRLYYYIERLYGVPRPERFRPFGDAPRGTQRPDASLPAPPLPGLPPAPALVVSLAPGDGGAPRAGGSSPGMPVAAAGGAATARPARAPSTPPPVPPPPPVAPANSAAAATTAASAPTPADDDDPYEHLELEASDLVESLDSDGAAPAPATPLAAADAAGGEAGPAPTLATATPAAPAPLTAGEAVAALAQATDRHQILAGVLGFAATAFDAAVLFTVRDHLALGARAIGPLPGAAHVEHLLVPLAAPSVLQAAAAGDAPAVQGAVVPSTVNAYLHRVLGCAAPGHAVLGRVAIGARVVNLIYGLRRAPLDDTGLRELGEVATAAAAAYARLIAVAKKPR